MDNLWVTFDGFNYTFLDVYVLRWNLVSLEAVDHHIDVLDFTFKTFAILLDYLEVDIIVVDRLTLTYIVLIL